MRVLLVDDDELVRFALMEMLSDAGYEVVETGDPVDALGLPEHLGPPDVLITDIDLHSELNGFEVASYAHQLWPKYGLSLSAGFPPIAQGDRSIRVTAISKNPCPSIACLEQSRNWLLIDPAARCQRLIF